MQTQPQSTSSSANVHKNSTPASKLLEIERKFSVPVAKLFAAFTSPEAIQSWWWPHGLHADRVELDFREGGNYFINMKGGEASGGGGMTGQFEKIVKNKSIVMTDYFADQDGTAITAKEAKMPGDWPDTIYITFEFEAVDENTSRFRLSQTGIPNELQKDCVQGWSESFDKLRKHLGAPKH